MARGAGALREKMTTLAAERDGPAAAAHNAPELAATALTEGAAEQIGHTGRTVQVRVKVEWVAFL